MSIKVIPTVLARMEFDRVLMYFIENNLPDVASRFKDRFEETLVFIGEFPEMGSPWDSQNKRMSNIRVKPVHGFENHLIFYRVTPETAYVLHLFHGHQGIDNLMES
jgi:toxin ParE1/3/4